MANTTKFVTKNGLQTQNVLFLSTDETSNIALNMYANSVLSFEGTNGQLFSIVDSLTDTIYSVNDISGLPSLEVFANGVVRMAEFSGNVNILSDLFVTGNIIGSVSNVALVATNTTAGTYYPTFVSSATGNEEIRTDTSLTYDPSTNILTVVSLGFSGNLAGSDAAGPTILNEVASATNPTLIPNKADTDTGIGWNSTNIGAFVAGGTASGFWNSNGIFGYNSAGSGLLNEAATSTNPTLIPNRADDNTGIGWSSADVLSLIQGGVERIQVGTDQTIFYHNIRVDNAAGPIVLNEAASATNPTLIPNRADDDTGIGGNGANEISIIAGGVSAIRADGSGQAYIGGTASPITGVALTLEDATDPQLRFVRTGGTGYADILAGSTGDLFLRADPGDTGASNSVRFYVDASERFGISAASLYSLNAAGPALMNEAATSTNPTLVPNRADDDTGIGWLSANSLSLVAGGARAVGVDSSGVFADNAAGGHLINEAATSTNPTLVPNRSELDTGIGWEAADILSFITGGVQRFRMGTGAFQGSDAAGPAMDNEAASNTNPTLLPNKADGDTGIGWRTTNALSLIAGGVAGFEVNSSSCNFYTNTLSGNGASSGTLVNETPSATNPTLVPNLSELDTGIGWASDTLHFIGGGATMGQIQGGSLHLSGASSAALMNEAVSSTNPTLIPNRSETGTGIGWNSANRPSIVAGGVEAASFTSIGMISSIGAAISAAGTVQGDATLLASDINNVTTVASGTGVIFPTAVAGMRLTVLNHGANALSVYPATGGQINALGANVAFTLAVGSGLDFVATSTTQWYTLNATYA